MLWGCDGKAILMLGEAMAKEFGRGMRWSAKKVITLQQKQIMKL